MKTRYILFLPIILCFLACGKSISFFELNAPVEDVLPQAVLTVPNEFGYSIEITIGNKKSRHRPYFYYGQSQYTADAESTHTFDYLVYYTYAVETNRYIFVPVAYGWGGSGIFYYLTAIDKMTLKGVTAAYLGDRVKIDRVKVVDRGVDTVSVTYIEREAGETYPAKNRRVKKFIFEQNMQMMILLNEN